MEIAINKEQQLHKQWSVLTETILAFANLKFQLIFSPTLAWLILAASSFDANPPNTRECIAPILAAASIDTTACGIMGM